MLQASARPTLSPHWRRSLPPFASPSRAGRHGNHSRLCSPPPAEDREEQTILELLPLVRRVAGQLRKHLPAHVETDDLVSLGALGLLDAVRKFDRRRHVKIESYARYRIRGAILDGLRDWDPASRDLRRKSKRTEQVQRDPEGRLGRPAEDEEMAQALGVSLQKWYRTVKELQPAGVGWLHPRGEGAAPPCWDENELPDTRESPFDRCFRRERRRILQRALAGLPPRERNIMACYYARQMTMKQIGARLGIDEPRVSQLHSAALHRLRAAVQAIQQRPPAPAVAAFPTFPTNAFPTA